MHGPVVLAFLILIGTVGCRVATSGLPVDAGSGGGATAQADAPPPSNGSGSDLSTEAGLVPEPPGVSGPGCSDGTREGFRDASLWPRIAGCAGGFSSPGVLGPPKPLCNLGAGDGSTNPAGVGCSAADLCATGWHVCRNGADVAASSATGCDGCVSPGEGRFFVAAMGASALGLCVPDATATNDLHGCGGMGEPESPTCAPLTRRMGAGDCLTTQGVWSCGGLDQADRGEEAALVTKTGPTMGGVLCCKD